MTANTLTDRYVHEVVRRIPAKQRADVADELRATIADTIDAREPEDRDAAEREVLTEMGDPILLAARYADRPQALIGPELYPAFVRLVTMLLAIVLPIVVAVVMAIEAIDTAEVGKTIGAGIGAVLTVGAQLIAWPTVIFAWIERVGGGAEVERATGGWNVDKLPDRGSESKRDLGNTIPSIVWNVLLIGLFLWNFSFIPDGGDRVHVLDQSLWSLWLWPILAGLTALVIAEIARIAVGRWTMALVGWYAFAQALFALPLVWVLSQREFLSPEFLAAIRSQAGANVFHTAIAVGVLVVSAYEIVRRFREARAVATKS